MTELARGLKAPAVMEMSRVAKACSRERISRFWKVMPPAAPAQSWTVPCSLWAWTRVPVATALASASM